MPLTPARLGLARLGATRLGYPVLAGVKVKTYAQLGVARLGATRLGYIRPSTFITINGVHYGQAPAVATQKVTDLEIHDYAGHAATTASFNTRGFIPPDRSEIIITMGSKNTLRRWFAGNIISDQLTYVDTPGNYAHRVQAIDYTEGLRHRLVSGYFTGTGTLIAQTWLNTYAPHFSSQFVQADLPTIDGGITVTHVPLDQCLTRLCARIAEQTGLDTTWKCDYYRRIHLFTGADASQTGPQPINAVSLTLQDHDQPVELGRDWSQQCTRVYVIAGGSQLLEQVGPGETILPVTDASWYQTSGVVKIGPFLFPYTSRALGVGGSLVGPGFTPTAAPLATVASGSGVDSGLHEIAVVFVTAAGKTLPGPRRSVTVGLVEPPADFPFSSPPTIGTGPNPGTHLYATTFKTSSGETTASPTNSVDTTLTPAPTTAPTPTLAVGTGIDNGAHDYARTFVTSIGETTPSPISGQVTTGPVTTGLVSDPSTAPTASAAVAGTGPDPGAHYWAATFTNSVGETLPSPISGTITTDLIDPPTDPTLTLQAGTELSVGDYDYAVTFRTGAGGETTPSPVESITTLAGASDPATFSSAGWGTSAVGSVTPGDHRWLYTFRRLADGAETAPSPIVGPITVPGGTWTIRIPLGAFVATPSGFERVLYRTKASDPAGTYFECDDASEAGGFLDDAESDASLGGAAPSSNTATAMRRVQVTNIPIGPTGTAERVLYRTLVGGGALKRLATIGDNTTTVHNDSTTDAALSAIDPPGANGAFVCVVALSNIPIGGAGTTTRKIYRTAAGGAQLKLAFTIANNSATTANDTITDASLGANAPTSNTTATTTNFNQVTLAFSAATDPNVTNQKIYRRSGGAGLKLLTTVAASATSYADSTPNASLGAAVPSVSTAYLQRFTLFLPLGGTHVTHVRIFGTAAGDSQLKFIAEVANGTATYQVTTTDAGLGANVPVVNTATANQIALTGIPIGPATVTAREIYMTPVGSAQLKLEQTIADNVTTAATVTTADSGLGANVPVSDTSGLTQPDGIVLAGATSIVVAGLGDFPATGWAVIGNGQQRIRYTGISGSSITGIPASGIGAISASIAYNSTITPAPQLTISTPVTNAIAGGEDVNQWVQVDDTDAQAAAAALPGGFTHSGIFEEVISDERLSYTEAVKRGEAFLAARSSLQRELTYNTTDINTYAGAIVTVNVGAPFSLQLVDFRVQSVIIDTFHPAAFPTFHVRAAPLRYALEDLVQRPQE